MERIIIKHFLLLLTLLGPISAFTQTNLNSLKTVQLITDDYEFFSNTDIVGHTSKVTKDYICVEDGIFWNLEDEIKHLFKSTTVIRTNVFDFHKITVYSETALAVYKLKSVFNDRGEISEKHWAESVFCKKINGVWKISLLHSTPIQK